MDSSTPEGFSAPILTETMARLLLEQRHWREAIGIYEQLGVQNPEKAASYQKKITEIKRYFDPRNNPDPRIEKARDRRRLKHLRKLLKLLEQDRPQPA